jgi:predicted phage-related endonuclease
MGIKAMELEESESAGMKQTKAEYLIDVCEKRDTIDQQIKELTQTKKAYEEAIKNTLGGPQKVTHGDWHISFTETTTRRIDTKMVRELHPAIAEECTTESVGTRLTISHAT